MENVFTLQKRASLAKILRDANTIGIIASVRQNFDTMGSALGLMLALTQSKKNAQVVSSKDPLVEISNLFGIDKVKNSFDSSLKQLTISFPFVEGEIEKAMYKTEGNKINVHFYAAKDQTITFNESDVQYIKKGGTPDVIFALAVSDDEIAEYVQNRGDVKIVRVSRHPKDTSGDIVYQDTSFSSVAEIVSKVIQEQGLALDSDAAQNLLDGIVFSTLNYTHPKTSAFAFDATGFLLKKGAQRRNIEETSRSTEEMVHEVKEPKKEKDQSEERKENAISSDDKVMFDTSEEEKQNDIQGTNGQRQEDTKKEKKQEEKAEDEDVPSDWFEPKVFKSSKSE